ncbi:MAG: hemolysin family protein [Corynebacterium sp.]|nr:hemolysin family protein [Corynebacterium sp.]
MDIFISILALIGFIALTVATGFFVAIEFALTGLEKSVIDTKVQQNGDATSKAIAAAHKDLSFELSGAQLGITITTLATGYLAEPVLNKYFEPLLHLIGLHESASKPVALILAMIVATLLSMVYGELVPKNMAITDPWVAARITVGPVRIFNKIFKPAIKLLNKAANALVRKLGMEPAEELASARSATELGALVRNSAKLGGIEAATAQVLDRSLRFGDATAIDFMTPRAKVETLPIDATVQDLMELSLETGYSRFPVVDGDLDATIGVVHVKEAFGVPRAARSTTLVRTLARPVPVIPGSLDGDSVLSAVRKAGPQIALVADEYGGTAGIVTTEDIVEELLGAVYDEHDDNAERDFVKIGSSWEIAGLVRTDELEEHLGYRAPDGPYETLGGLIMSILGRIPAAGDVITLPVDPHHEEAHPWKARVTLMDGRRIAKAIVTPLPAKAGKNE